MIGKAMNDNAAQGWSGKLHVSNNNFDAAKLLSSLQSRIVVDMDAQACAEALSGLNAYYKVRLIAPCQCGIELTISGSIEDFRRQCMPTDLRN
jgi:hypothetical protein